MRPAPTFFSVHIHRANLCTRGPELIEGHDQKKVPRTGRIPGISPATLYLWERGCDRVDRPDPHVCAGIVTNDCVAAGGQCGGWFTTAQHPTRQKGPGQDRPAPS